MSAIIPIPKQPVSVRVATLADLPFIDGLQKASTRALGYFPTKQLQEYIGRGDVLVAEGTSAECCVLSAETTELAFTQHSAPSTQHRSSHSAPSTQHLALGYVISRDRYLKRDELGVIYQLCVAPGAQRKLVGAALVRAVFARAAYGCRLFCCWCAQDLAANRFWESLGFVPIAFRTGGRGRNSDEATKRRSDEGEDGAGHSGARSSSPFVASSLRRSVASSSRLHIFWQRRTRDGDDTPYWYPSATNAGAIRADRLVFPIPPGTHWADVRPIELPSAESGESSGTALTQHSAPSTQHSAPRAAKRRVAASAKRGPRPMGGFRFQSEAPPVTEKKASRPRAVAAKIDPRLFRAARELRDRWMEHVNAGAEVLAMEGKYDVARPLEAPAASVSAMRCLPDRSALGAHADGNASAPALVLPAAA